MKRCPNCGTEAESKFCPECGTELVDVEIKVEKKNICPNCGTESETKFCPECGTRISEDAPSVEDAAVVVASNETNDTEIVAGNNEPEAKPKKKLSKKTIIIIAAAIVVLLVLIGAAGSSEDSSSSDSSSDYEYEEEEDDFSIYDKPSGFKTEACQSVSYDALERTPDDYYGTYITISGTVIQVIDGDTVSLRVDVSGNYDDVVYVEYDPSIMDVRVLEDDNVTLYGISTGIYTYESSGAGSISIPSMVAYSITIN